MTFVLPKEALSDNVIQRRLVLDDYFPVDLIPYEELVNNAWKIRTFISTDASFYVDPFIEKALQNFSEPISLMNMSQYWRLFKNSMLSLNDSWSLYYWSLLFSWLQSKNEIPKKVTLLHVDDHRDLASPLIILNEDCKSIEATPYRCLFSSQGVDFADPESIANSISVKSIDIASFNSPFLHMCKSSINMLHLRYAEVSSQFEKNLSCTFTPDSLLAPGRLRPSLNVGEASGSHLYSIATKPEDLFESMHDSSLILLHLDCDAFNNRYNRDSNWTYQKPSVDWNLQQIKDKISDLLKKTCQLSLPVYLNVALSPGFFPSEYWKEVYQHICSEGLKWNIIRDDEFSEFLKNSVGENQSTAALI
jgi:hypothetical protein